MSDKNDFFLNFKRWLQGRLSRERRRALRQHFAEPLGLVFRRNLPMCLILRRSEFWIRKAFPGGRRNWKPRTPLAPKTTPRTQLPGLEGPDTVRCTGRLAVLKID